MAWHVQSTLRAGGRFLHGRCGLDPVRMIRRPIVGGIVRDPAAVTRVAVLAVAVWLVCAACTSGTSQSQSPRPRSSTVSPVAHPLLTKLHQQTELRFVHPNGANPNAVTVFISIQSEPATGRTK